MPRLKSSAGVEFYQRKNPCGQWTVLRLSLSQQLDNWLQLSYPTHIKAAADKMDQILWEVLEVAAGSSIPTTE